MFHLSSRALAKLNTVLASRRCLPNLTRTFLWPLYRPVAASALRFLSSSSDKSSKPHVLKKIGKTNCFEIGSIKFTFGINEFVSDKNKFVGIRSCDIKNENKHICHIWISIPAAQILLEKVEEVSKRIDDNDVESLAKERCLIRFIDEERNYLIKLKLAYRDLDHLGTKLYLQVRNSCIDTAKGSSIFIPLSGITTFLEKLSNILRQYKKWIDPSKRHGIEDLCKMRSFLFDTKRYFLSLGRETRGILVSLREFNKETDKKRSVYVPIAAAHTLFSLLKDGFMTVQRYEGCLPGGMQPLGVLHEKSFIHEDREYIVRVQIIKSQLRHLGNTILMIWSRKLDNDNQNNVMIGGKRAHLLLQHYEEILREYDRLKSYLTEADSSKPYEPIEEPKKRTFDQKINPTKAETEPNDLMSEER